MKAKKKAFDCVRMKREGAAQVQREISGMSMAEELAYWAKGTEQLLAKQSALRAHRRRPSKRADAERDEV